MYTKTRYIYDYSGVQRRPVGVVVSDGELFGTYFDSIGKFNKKFARQVATDRMNKISVDANFDRVPKHRKIVDVMGDRVQVSYVVNAYLLDMVEHQNDSVNS